MEYDKKIFLKACDSIKYILETNNLTSKRKVLLRKLLEVSLEKYEKQEVLPIEVSTQELYTNEYVETKAISDWHKSLQVFLEKNSDVVIDLAKKNNLEYYFRINKVKGEGVSTLYSIVPVLVPKENYVVPEFGIKFEADKLRLPIWIKWFDGFTLIGWRKWFFALVIVVFGIITFFSLIMINPSLYSSSHQWISVSFMILVLTGNLYWILRPFKRAIDLRIIQAPLYFLPFDTYYGQLESTWDCNNNRFFRIIVYKSVCPVCGGRVNVMEGKNKYVDRMVGRSRYATEKQ